MVGFETWWATMLVALEMDGFPVGRDEIASLARRAYEVGFADGEQSVTEDLDEGADD
jgi:hypothetical protein